MNFFNFIRSIIVKIGAVAKFSSSMCMKGPMSTSSFNINSFNFWILSPIHSRIIFTDFSVFEAYIGYIELIIISIDKLPNVWKKPLNYFPSEHWFHFDCTSSVFMRTIWQTVNGKLHTKTRVCLYFVKLPRINYDSALLMLSFLLISSLIRALHESQVSRHLWSVNYPNVRCLHWSKRLRSRQ